MAQRGSFIASFSRCSGRVLASVACLIYPDPRDFTSRVCFILSESDLRILWQVAIISISRNVINH